MPIVGSFAGASSRAYGFQSGLIGDFESIATQTVGAGGASDITFSNIPQNYTHLQVRTSARVNSGDSYQLLAQFNGDTGSNYSYHYVFGNGSSVSSGGVTSQTQTSLGSQPGSSSSANIFGFTICDILDYANTNKFKTTRGMSGAERGASPSYVFMPSGNWRSTSAITSIKLFSEGAASFVQYSTFTLYGIKG